MMNRPDALNSLTDPMKDALRDGLADLARDESVRAVVLTGAGRAFSAGQDLKEHLTKLGGSEPPLSTVTEHYNPIVIALASMPKPTIAAVNGMAAGAGASFAYACDFRIAAQSAKFLLAFANIGLSVDSGASYHLPRLIGQAKALETMLLAKPVTAQEALASGMVGEVVPDADLANYVQEFATKLAAGPTAAYGMIKQAVQFAASHDLAQSLAREGELMGRSGQTQDHAAAVAAFVAKEKATFTGA
ncbi:MAG: enoyl-CoA hydratase-related protein [Antricoccus sp.]